MNAGKDISHHELSTGIQLDSLTEIDAPNQLKQYAITSGKKIVSRL